MDTNRDVLPDDKERVTVYVYPRDANSSSPKTWLRTGHAAVRTHVGGDSGYGIHASFWPGTCHETYDASLPLNSQSTEKQNICNESKPHLHTYRQDTRMYSLNPHQFELSLDAETVNREFKEFKEGGFNWSVLGSSILKKKKSQNCSGLSYHLLEKSGAKTPAYPRADMYGHIILASHFLEAYSQLHAVPTRTRIAASLVESFDHDAGSRMLGVTSEILGETSGLSDLITLLSIASIGVSFSKDNAFAFNRGTGIIVGTVALLLTLLFYTRTVSPNDIATMGHYNEDLQNDRYQKFLPQYQLKEYGFISREFVNGSLAVTSGISNAYVAYQWPLLSDIYSNKFLQVADIGFTSALNTGVVMFEPRMLITAAASALPFVGSRFRGSRGVIGTTSTITNHLCDIRYAPFFVLAVPAIFYLADRLIKKIENKPKRRQLTLEHDDKKAERKEPATQQHNRHHKPSPLYYSLFRKLPKWIKPRHVIQGVAYGATFTIGYLYARSMVAKDAQSRATATPAVPPSTPLAPTARR